MQVKTFRLILLFIVLLLAFVLGYGTNTGNYILALVALPTGILILLILKTFVQGVSEDERSYRLAGDAARWAFSIFIVCAAIASNVLIALGIRGLEDGGDSPFAAQAMTIAGTTLSLAVAFLFFVYLIAYLIYRRRS